jgi:hypothetical protein
MSVENWIDSIVDMWGAMDAHAGHTLRAYLVYRKAEFPAALSDFPCVLTFVDGLQPNYSAGGPLIDAWTGISEFHLWADLSPAHYPELMLYFARIRTAMAQHLSLGGRVSHFLPRADVPYPIRGPVKLKYGGEEDHLGIVVQWQVKENVSGEFTIAAG